MTMTCESCGAEMPWEQGSFVLCCDCELESMLQKAVVQREVWADWDACRANEANWREANEREPLPVGGDVPF